MQNMKTNQQTLPTCKMNPVLDLASLLCMISGSMLTSEIYKNIPAVMAMIHKRIDSSDPTDKPALTKTFRR